MKLIQEEHDARQKTRGGDHKSEEFKNQAGKNSLLDSAKAKDRNITRYEIAKEHGVPQSAVKSAVMVGRGIDRAAKVDPEFKKEVLSGELKAQLELGKRTVKMGSNGGDRRSNNFSRQRMATETKNERLAEIGISHQRASEYERMAEDEETVEQYIEDSLANGKAPTKGGAYKEVKESKKPERLVLPGFFRFSEFF